jgi:hypothetical protein
MRGRLSVAIAIAALAASTAYVLACAYELAVAGRGDPYLIVRDVHFGYYHRVALAAWVGGIAGIVAHYAVATEDRVRRAEEAITRAVLPLLLVLAVGTFVFP